MNLVLKVLYLKGNKIVYIDELKHTNFPKLKDLNLNNNKISVIDDLEHVNFKQLKVLSLNNNQISDIFLKHPQAFALPGSDPLKVCNIQILYIFASENQTTK